MRYLLIKNGIVENIIIAEPSFIPLIQDEWDNCICEKDIVLASDKWVKEGEIDLLEQPMIDENTVDNTWTYVPGDSLPQIGWSYDGENFSPGGE
jgi:hypothetical protein